MSVSFLTPLAALVAIGASVPLVAAVIRERRADKIRRAVGLKAPTLAAHRNFIVATLAFFLLVGLAAAQPVIRSTQTVKARTDVEAFFLVDASRSMLAARTPGGITRFDRAISLGLSLRNELLDVPAGVASITDRPLPHLFPTPNVNAFSGVMQRAVGVDRPRPSRSEHVRATDFGSISALATDNYFSRQSTRRLVILLTDAETRPFDPGEVLEQLADAGVAVILVRLWSPEDRIYLADGREDPGYQPNRSSDSSVAQLASMAPGGRVFGEDDVDDIAVAARAYVGEGPSRVTRERERVTGIAPYLMLAAGVPLAFLIGRRIF